MRPVHLFLAIAVVLGLCRNVAYAADPLPVGAQRVGGVPNPYLTSDVAISDDCRSVAITMRVTARSQQVIVNGVRRGQAQGIACAVLSPDGLKVAYVSRDAEGRETLYVNGESVAGHDAFGDLPQSLRFSPDSTRLAYTARMGDQWFVAVDGKPGPVSQTPPAEFSFSPHISSDPNWR